MAEPVIVPPPPTIVQPHGVDTSPGLEQVQKAFDQVLPERKKPPPSTEPPVSPPASPVPEEPLKPAVPETPPPKPEETDVPSFLEQALRGGEPAAAPVTPAEEEWPEELPEFKTPEEKTARYKKWRETYKNLKSELEAARQRPQTDPQQAAKLEMLEAQNRQFQDVMSRLGVEHSAEFQQNIMRPLYASWGEAARIVQQSGGDPQELAKAMALGGKAQFEALDQLFMEMPESAKTEAHDALRTYRRYEEARRAAIANAPQALEGIRKREMERQLGELNRQREDMKSLFESAVKTLRDGRLEVLLKTEMPEGQWWNEQADRIVEQARNLYLENTDMNKVALACLLAPTAEVFRKLWINSQKKIGQLQKIIDERIGNEPDLSESGGSQAMPTSEAQMREDLRRPFHEAFLREFHRSQARNR
jgi:hypothetical protein